MEADAQANDPPPQGTLYSRCLSSEWLGVLCVAVRAPGSRVLKGSPAGGGPASLVSVDCIITRGRTSIGSTVTSDITLHVLL